MSGRTFIRTANEMASFIKFPKVLGPEKTHNSGAFKSVDSRRNSGGRPKGTPNKTTQTVKAIIEEAIGAVGGAQRLAEWARENPQNEYAFWVNIVPRLLPRIIEGSPE